MADKINVEVTRREAIKPYSLTPQHLKTVKLSLLDQTMLDMYVPVILFYRFTKNSHTVLQNPDEIVSMRLQRLRETLSKTLALYYPFAGKLRNNLFVECTDEGVEFVEAKTPAQLSEVLADPDPILLTKFVAAWPESGIESHGGRLLFVQATIFECRGIAVGLSFSHKLADTCTLCGFIETWAKIANGDHDRLLTKPEFSQACSIFAPTRAATRTEDSYINLIHGHKSVTRRFVFSAERIGALKRKVAKSEYVRNPTRVEAISALFWKSFLKASALRLSSNAESPPRMSIFSQTINFRKRLVPPLGENTVGNIFCLAQTAKKECSEAMDLEILVQKFREGIEEATRNLSAKELVLGYVQKQQRECAALAESNEAEFYGCTSWCRFGLYEADFGWEKPLWVSLTSMGFNNSVFLMDSKDGVGIEAWVMLQEQDMTSVERDEELLAFASLNPSVF